MIILQLQDFSEATQLLNTSMQTKYNLVRLICCDLACQNMCS